MVALAKRTAQIGQACFLPLISANVGMFSTLEKLLIAFVILTISHAGSYFYGKVSAISKVEILEAKQENKDLKSSIETKERVDSEFKQLEIVKSETYSKLDSDYRSLLAKYNRMRVCAKQSNESASPGTAHSGDRTSEEQPDRIAAGGVDITEIATDVIELGKDLDRLTADKIELQGIAQKLREECVMRSN